MMRIIVTIVAVFVTLGLAAVGVGVAQNAAGPSSLVALAAHAIASGHDAAAQAVNRAAASIGQSPIIKVSDTKVSDTAGGAAATASAPAPAAATAPAQPASPAPMMLAQNAQQPGAAASAAPTTPAAANTNNLPWPTTLPQCNNPDALGMSRIVQIDTTGGPAFGNEHFKQYDFLRDKEVVLTFDDGPWPENTEMVLKALQDNCVRATFFEIGEHATWHPELSRELEKAGMTIGSHTWSHKDLARNPFAKDIEQAKQEVEMGVSAVHFAAQGPIAPFFRFPDLQMPQPVMAYLGTRNIATFSADLDTVDYKLRKPEDVIKSVMTKLAKSGKGILLMHDFKHPTAEAMPELLHQLHLAGYKVVGMVPKFAVTTIPKYDDMVRTDDKFSSSNNTRPESSVVKTIGQ